MSVDERNKWGFVPMDLAHHCENCGLVSAAPNGRCVQCQSESVSALARPSTPDADPAPVHPVDVVIHIGGDDFDYIRRMLPELAGDAETRTADSFGMFGGGGGGCYSVTTATRDISVEGYREELAAWYDRQRAKRDAASQVINGEPVVLPAGAVMGAEMIAPEQRNQVIPSSAEAQKGENHA